MEKIFVGGIYSKEVPETAPNFILGQGSFHVEKLITWLQENKHLASDRGYINWKLLEGKTGTRYYEVDTWKPKKQETDTLQGQEAEDNKAFIEEQKKREAQMQAEGQKLVDELKF